MTRLPLLNFWNASPAEVRQYYEWYISTMKDRLLDLTALFRSSGGSGDLDFSFDSFRPLSQWLKQNVQFRSRTAAEIEPYRSSTPEWLVDSLKQPILIDFWYDRSADVGAYIGETFIRQYPFLNWNLSAKKRGTANFGRPVLRTRSGFELSPITVAHTVMVGMQGTTDSVKRLELICLRWKEVIEKET